jgi:hypothetical protein
VTFPDRQELVGSAGEIHVIGTVIYPVNRGGGEFGDELSTVDKLILFQFATPDEMAAYAEAEKAHIWAMDAYAAAWRRYDATVFYSAVASIAVGFAVVAAVLLNSRRRVQPSDANE